MADLVSTASGFLGRRLFVTAWLPILVFLAAFATLVAAGTGWPTVMWLWDHTPLEARVAGAAALLAATAILAWGLRAVRLAVFRLYEGHWAGLVPYGEALEARYRAHHLRRHAEHGRRQESGEPWPDDYPRHPRRVMPTRLGNLLRACEEHAYLRYGIDSVTAWPRLYVVLPDTFRETFGTVATTVELMLNVSVLSVAFAVAGGAAAAVLLPWYAVPLTVWSGTALAWLAYRAAVRAASGYAALVRAAFDVHRWKLLDEMGLRRPTGYAEERAQWAQLRKLWREMGPDSDGAHLLRYPTEDPPAAATSDAPDPAPADLTPAEPASALPSAWAVHGPAPAATSTPPQAKADITPPATTPAPPATASATPAPAETADTPARPDETARPTRAATARRWARTLLLGRRNPARLPVDIARLVLLAGIAAAIPTALIGLVADSPQAARELPAYHQLTAADVRGEAASLAERYTLRPFREGETIDPTFLGPKLDRSALAGRVITTVTAEAGGAAVARKGGRVTLLAPAKGGSFIVVGEVVVLDLLPSDRVVIAVAKADLPRLASGAAGPVRLLADAK